MKLIKDGDNIPSFTGITCDSRRVKSGYAFVAITGYKEDGHSYIEDAVSRGAKVVFAEKDVNIDINVPLIRVEDSRLALGKLAAEFYSFPADKLNVIGVTGTNGKTTTTHLIYNLLNYKRKQSGLIGTVAVETGVRSKEGKLTTPAPDILQKYLSEMVDSNYKYACMEVSSHGIKLKRIAGTYFSVKIGTNITVDHFDLHTNFIDYLKVKKQFLADNNSNTLVLINNDDSYLRNFGSLAENQLNYGIKTGNKTPIVAENINYNGVNTKFVYNLNKAIPSRDRILKPCSFPIKMQLPGKHNIYNALIAVTIGLYYGLKPSLIQKFFAGYGGVWRRLQVIYNRDFTIIDDCAHNPGSYRAVFNTLKNINYNKLHLVNSLRGNRGSEINQVNAETISHYLKKISTYTLYTTSCRDVVKEIDRVNEEEKAAFLQTLKDNNIEFTHYQNLHRALENTLTRVKKDDLILLLGPHAMDEAGDMILKMINGRDSLLQKNI